MEKKSKNIIWYLIVFLILLFASYLAYFLYLIMFTKSIEYFENEDNYNRFIGITNICSVYDADYNSPECVDISFSDYDNSVKSIKAILDPGYGVDPNTGNVVYIGITKSPKLPKNTPYTPSNKNFMFEKNYTNSPYEPTRPHISIPQMTNLDKKFDKDNIDIQYHADPANLPNAKDDLIGYSVKLDNSGNIQTVPYSELRGGTLYNQPGTSRFGPSSYVPNYEETVFLSKLTNESPFKKMDESAGSLGFCKNSSLEDIEKKCRTLDNQTCASTECCVLFGGAKCVAGNSKGPSKQSNYSDILVKNRDYYYYKGSCYGNCSHSYGIENTDGYRDDKMNYSNV